MLNELKRVSAAVMILLVSAGVFMSGLYALLPNPIQLLDLKTMQVAAGFLVAHILRKALLPDVNWSNDDNWQHTAMVISLYVIIIYAFAMGG